MYIVSDEQFNAKFWSRIVHEGECWLWTGPVINSGYGQVTRYRRHILAHRYAYELTHGPIPDGELICHTCDRKLCVNPAHLFAGTQKENMGDMSAKGRAGWTKNKHHGSDHWKAKLTEDDIRSIRARAGSIARPALAAEYGISLSSVDKIINRETWRHVA